jgi:hypothetical protein
VFFGDSGDGSGELEMTSRSGKWRKHENGAGLI